MSMQDAKRFLDDLGKKPILKSGVNAEQSIVDVAKVYDPTLDFTVEELDNALKEKWGDTYSKCLLWICFSEAPGF